MPRARGDLTMNSTQTELVETALHQLAKMDPCGWHEVPELQRPFFAEYMDREVWTGGVDLFTLRDAALMLIRDAIARKGAFAVQPAPARVRHGGQGSFES
jgi:hypothetical protein